VRISQMTQQLMGPVAALGSNPRGIAQVAEGLDSSPIVGRPDGGETLQ
jgi:hypothetical protein